MYLTFMSRELCLRFLIYVLVLVYVKKRVISFFVIEYFLQNFIKKRHSSLDNNVFNTHLKFQVWVVHSKGGIHVQKIKVENIFFKYICHSFRVMIVYFHELYIIRKASYSV